jgi:hypothetical protein
MERALGVVAMQTSGMSAAAGRLAQVEKWKRPYGCVSRWDAYVLAEDGYGLWLHTPKGSLHHLWRDGPWVAPCAGVQLIPASSPWWVAWFWDPIDRVVVEPGWGDPARRRVFADMCVPASYEVDVWKYVDLELDVVGDEEGFVLLADEDEFDAAVGAGLINETEAQMARAAAADVQVAMSSLQEPFATAGWRMLDDAVARELPPTT